MRALLVVGLATSLLAGCAPETPYRYSAFTPSARPLAWDGRTSKAGTLRLEGTASNVFVSENITPQVHDTALQVPTWTVEGAALIAVSKNVELGLRGAYASYDWATPSAVGTMPVPGASSSWGIGPEVRIDVPLDREKRFHLGIGGNVVDYQVPYAQWTLTGTGSACNPSPTCVQGYSLTNSQTEAHMSYSLAILPSYAFGDQGEYGHVFGGITATTGFQNDGFATQSQNGSTINTFWPLWIASAGYGVLLDDLVRLSGSVYRPLNTGGNTVNYDLGFFITAGFDINLFGAPPPSEPRAPASGGAAPPQ